MPRPCNARTVAAGTADEHRTRRDSAHPLEASPRDASAVQLDVYAERGGRRVLSEREARQCTDRARRKMGSLEKDLLRLHKGKAHVALGYTSWDAYFESEFGQDGSY